MNVALSALPRDVSIDVFQTIAADLRRVVFDAPFDAADALGYFIANAEHGDPWRAAILDDKTCRSLLDTLWANYVVFAVLPKDTRNRRVLKYCYSDDFDFATDGQSLIARLHLSELCTACGDRAVLHRLPGCMAGTKLPCRDCHPGGVAGRARLPL